METALTWILTCLSITGVILTVKKSRMGYAFFVVANAGWITVNIRNEIYAQAFLFAVYTCLSVWGFIEWTRKPPCKD
ncbi:nicotinamide mononucleotide transporter [Desulfocurvus sp. DL9XJH121]